MIHGRINLNTSDIKQLAHLHKITLGESLFSLLGFRLLCHYYQFVMMSDKESLFVHKKGEEVSGAVVVSLFPQTLGKRFVQKNLFYFTFSVFIRLFIQPTILIKLWQSRTNNVRHLPELVQIFTHPDMRHQNIGSALISDVEKFLHDSGKKKYFLKTRTDNNQSTVAFYQKNGFSQTQQTEFGGLPFLIFEKTLS